MRAVQYGPSQHESRHPQAGQRSSLPDSTFTNMSRSCTPLLKARNAVLLPHIRSGSLATRTAMARVAFDSVAQVLEGEMPENARNPA